MHSCDASNDAESLFDKRDDILNDTQTYESSEELQDCRKRAQVAHENKKELEKMGLTFFTQSWQFYAKEHWNKICPFFDAKVTEPPSVRTPSRISGVHTMETDEPEIDLNVIMKFSYFCRMVLTPGANVIILADYFMIDIWLLTDKISSESLQSVFFIKKMRC